MTTRWQTRLIHSQAGTPAGFRSLATPTYRGSTTLFDRAADIVDTWDHRERPYTYGQYGTPTTLTLAARVAELEGGRHALVVPGGQCALTLVYLALLRQGAHVLVPDSVYGPSRAFADQVLSTYGVEVEYYPPLEGAAIASRIRPATALVWCESPGSITMEVQDVPAVAAAARARGVPVAVDNTWSAGVFFNAFAHGADISVQALTKYIGGHSDLLLGSIVVSDEGLFGRLGAAHQHLGVAASPDDCALALRGLQTLHVRLAHIERSARIVADWFARRPDVERVLHPALPSCPGHEWWARDFTGAAGLFSVVFRPPVTRREIHEAMDRMRLFRMGYSWGGVTSLIVTPDLAKKPNAAAYGDRLVRLSIGLEAVDDLLADLEQAFTAIGG